MDEDLPRPLKDFDEACKTLLLAEKLLGCDPHDHQNKMNEYLETCLAFADKLDFHSRNTGKGTVAGGVTSVIGGCIFLTGVGLALAPFTAGASLAVTVAGVGLGTSAAGGLVSFGSGSVKIGLDMHTMSRCKQMLDEFAKCTKLAEQILYNCESTFAKARDFSQSSEGQSYFRNLERSLAGKAYWKQLIINGGTLVKKTVFKSGGNVATTLRIVKLLRCSKMIQAGDVVSDIAFSSSSAMSMSCIFNELAIPAQIPGIGGRVLFKAGSAGVKTCVVVGGLASIAFGIWDIYSGVKDIHNDHETSEKIRVEVRRAQAIMNEFYPRFIKTYDFVKDHFG